MSQPDPRETAAAIRKLMLGHRERVIAGVPGCSCKAVYPGSTVRELSFYHADHLSRLVTGLILSTLLPEPVPA